jgi:hypothetical protein
MFGKPQIVIGTKQQQFPIIMHDPGGLSAADQTRGPKEVIVLDLFKFFLY